MSLKKMKVWISYKTKKAFSFEGKRFKKAKSFELPWFGYQISQIGISPKRDSSDIMMGNLIDPVYVDRKDFLENKIKKLTCIYLSYIKQHPEVFEPSGEETVIS